MKRVSLLAAVVVAGLWAATPAAQSKATGRLIEITAAMEGAKYSFKPDVINAKPGEMLHVRLKSAGAPMPKMAMSHNFVLLKPTTKISDFTTAAISAGFPANYIPASKKADIIASTPLAGVGETVDVTFKAPAAGTYPFICSFPGHEAAGMKGSLVVK